MEEKTYKVYKIVNGIAIDHIPNKQALNVLKVLGLDKEHDSMITMGMNLTSSKIGTKDVIKIENKELSAEELDKIALVAPTATINIIQNSEIVRKHKAVLPEKIIGLVKCPNPNCITRNEKIKTIFYPAESKLRCHYCERSFEKEDLELV
jgi:aspartate carbamoyltransferase regulatory subunit